MHGEFLTLAPACKNCGLSFAFADAGNRAGCLRDVIRGYFGGGRGALGIEVLYEPPYWVYLVIFPPLTAIKVCIGMLRPLKGLLIALQYRNKAEDGRLES